MADAAAEPQILQWSCLKCIGSEHVEPVLRGASACQADARRVSIFNNLSVQIKIATRHGERSVRSPVDLYFCAFALFFSDLDKKGRIQRIGDENAIARDLEKRQRG